MLSALLPLWLFMLLPVWIPMLAIGFGMVGDRIQAARGRGAEPTVQERIHARRQHEAQHGRHVAVVAAQAA